MKRYRVEARLTYDVHASTADEALRTIARDARLARRVTICSFAEDICAFDGADSSLRRLFD